MVGVNSSHVVVAGLAHSICSDTARDSTWVENKRISAQGAGEITCDRRNLLNSRNATPSSRDARKYDGASLALTSPLPAPDSERLSSLLFKISHASLSTGFTRRKISINDCLGPQISP